LIINIVSCKKADLATLSYENTDPGPNGESPQTMALLALKEQLAGTPEGAELAKWRVDETLCNDKMVVLVNDDSHQAMVSYRGTAPWHEWVVEVTTTTTTEMLCRPHT
jgi:hypothetical protein